jgi:hypothetical protein
MTEFIILALASLGIIALGEVVSRSDKKSGVEGELTFSQWHVRSVTTTQRQCQSVR